MYNKNCNDSVAEEEVTDMCYKGLSFREKNL